MKLKQWRKITFVAILSLLCLIGVYAHQAYAEDVPTISKGASAESEGDKEYTGSILLNTNNISIKQGASYQLKATLTEENLTGKKVTYKSSNSKIITINDKGNIKAIHWGKANITVTLDKAIAICQVVVSEDVTITISAAGDCTLSSDIKQPKSVNFYSVYNNRKMIVTSLKM